jgi:phosphatidylinositol alpha-mannosyltransferase
MLAGTSPAVAAGGGVLPPRKCARHFLRRSILALDAEQLGDLPTDRPTASSGLRALAALTPYSAEVRIGLVCPYSLTLPGGVQGQVLGLARSLRAAGHEARVLGPCDGPPPDAGVTPLGNCIPLAANGSVAPIAPDLPCALRTIRALRDEDFDVVHLHEPMVPGPCMTAGLLASSPLVGTFHAAGTSASYKWAGGPLRWLASRLDRRCAVSEDARRLAEAHLAGSYELVFNGIEVERFAKATPEPTDGRTILFLGRHEPRKGLAVLLDAMAALPADVRLWVASDGPETARLQAATAGDPRIEWLGRLDDDEKARRLRAADAFCAPSLHGESFGVVLLEAMAAGTPIVASDLPGYRNVARPGVEALLVPPGDAGAVAAALHEVLTSVGCAEALVAAGEARAEALSMDHLAERYLDLYSELVAA